MTSQSFNITSGTWSSYDGVPNDVSGGSTGEIVNGVRQWNFDIDDGGQNYFSTGSGYQIHFIPGTADDNGTWYIQNTLGTRNGRVITSSHAVFNETDAFVNGVVPTTGGSGPAPLSTGSSTTSKKVFCNFW